MKNKKKKTPNIRWLGNGRVREEAATYGDKASGRSTPNAERPTPNAQQTNSAQFDLEERLLQFSARIIRLVDALPNSRAASHVAGQLLRSGTSPYGNHGEVEAAESRKDFIHKLKICLKELKETRRRLALVRKAEMLPASKMAPILSENEELIRIFFSSIRTAGKNAK